MERTAPLGSVVRLHRARQLKKKFYQWQRAGANGPMPNFGKQQVVIDYIKRYSLELFVETGTYKGKMVYAAQPYVKEIYSIELDETHCLNAQKRFAGFSNVHIIQGQSGEVLPEVLKKIDQPCLFWLDAHYSGGSTAKADLETPIMQEMECILNHKRVSEHVILIDDARLFIGENDYPTLSTLQSFVLNMQPDWIFEVTNDIIRTRLDGENIDE